MAKHSKDGTVVEYAVQEMFKKKSPNAAAKATAKKLGGFANVFVGGGSEPLDIDVKELEEALWDRMANYVASSIPRFRAGKEHYALGGTISHFQQKPTIRAELKRRVIAALGADPFIQDDGT